MAQDISSFILRHLWNDCCQAPFCFEGYETSLRNCRSCCKGSWYQDTYFVCGIGKCISTYGYFKRQILQRQIPQTQERVRFHRPKLLDATFLDSDLEFNRENLVYSLCSEPRGFGSGVAGPRYPFWTGGWLLSGKCNQHRIVFYRGVFSRLVLIW